MIDREKVIKAAEICLRYIEDGDCPTECPYFDLCTQYEKRVVFQPLIRDALILLKEQEKKQITLHKKHVITWRRNDEFSMRKLYEAICETLLDEGELFIARTDDHEKVDFVFYVAEGR